MPHGRGEIFQTLDAAAHEKKTPAIVPGHVIDGKPGQGRRHQQNAVKKGDGPGSEGAAFGPPADPVAVC